MNTTTTTTIFSTLPQTVTELVFPTLSPANNSTSDDIICKWILYREINNSGIRIVDVTLFLPNILFLLFLLGTFSRAQQKLQNSTPATIAFYFLVFLGTIVSVIRCIVSMSLNAAAPGMDKLDKALWVIVRFFLLFTEISVLTLALAFGHLDTRTSIRRALYVTSFIAFIYSGTQGALEITAPDELFFVYKQQKGVFGHGGVGFWFASSLVFSLVYWIVFLLPFTFLRNRIQLPYRKHFYWYVLFLALLNMVQTIGSALLFSRIMYGLCIVNMTELLYFILYLPVVYLAFLAQFFSAPQPSITFSYRPQVDETVEDDASSLPHQLSCSSLKTDSDFIYQNAGSIYDSTHFDGHNVNPLYVHSLHSPDSLTGSINNPDGGGGAPATR